SNSYSPAGRLAANVPVRPFAEDGPQAAAEDLVVVGQQDTHGLHAMGRWRTCPSTRVPPGTIVCVGLTSRCDTMGLYPRIRTRCKNFGNACQRSEVGSRRPECIANSQAPH